MLHKAGNMLLSQKYVMCIFVCSIASHHIRMKGKGLMCSCIHESGCGTKVLVHGGYNFEYQGRE